MSTLYKDIAGKFTIETQYEKIIKGEKYFEPGPESPHRRYARKRIWPRWPRDGTRAHGYTFIAHSNCWLKGQWTQAYYYKYRIGARFGIKWLRGLGLPIEDRWWGIVTIKCDKPKDYDDWVEFYKAEITKSIEEMEQNKEEVIRFRAAEVKAKHKAYTAEINKLMEENDDEEDLIIEDEDRSSPASTPISTKRSRRKSAMSFIE